MKHKTKNNIGAKKMLDNGQKVPVWMLSYSDYSTSKLFWDKFQRHFDKKILQGG